MAVAGRRCIDETEEAFVFSLEPGVNAPVLRAYVDGRVVRKPLVLDDVFEFPGVVARKEHVVPVEYEPRRLRLQTESHSGKRTYRRALSRHAGCDAFAEVSCRERRGIGVADNGRSFELVSGFADDTTNTAMGEPDFPNRIAKTKLGAERFRLCLHGAGQYTHAAFNREDARLFDMRDKHERCGSQERRRATVCCITAEQLSQSRILEPLAQRAP